MGFWDTAGRVALDAGTLGAAEIPGNILWGGLGKSTNPADYQVNSPNQAQMAVMTGQQRPNSIRRQAVPRHAECNSPQQLQRSHPGSRHGAGEPCRATPASERARRAVPRSSA